MKRISLLLACLAMVLALPVQGASAAASFKIGLMCPKTGKWASEGLDMQQIVTLLVDKTNKAGGINGMQIELIVEDDAGDPRSAALAAQKLASAGVKVEVISSATASRISSIRGLFLPPPRPVGNGAGPGHLLPPSARSAPRGRNSLETEGIPTGPGRAAPVPGPEKK